MRYRAFRVVLTTLIVISLGPATAPGQAARSDPSAQSIQGPPEGHSQKGISSLTPATFSTWRDRLQPTETELAFRRIPWRTDLARAVSDAERTRRPILLWLMNGHPLGPT